MTGTGQPASYLTKSDFLRFRTCPAYCWTYIHRPEHIPEDPPEVQRRERDGEAVEALARQVFPGAVLIEAMDPVEATRATEEAIVHGANTIFQASVLTETGLHARADVLVREGNGWNLIEIKSSTSVDFDHRIDATFQLIAFTEAGYDIRNVQVMHLDRRYRLNGQLDLNQLFRFNTRIMAWAQSRLHETRCEITEALEVVRDPTVCPRCTCDRKTRGKRCPTFAVFNPGFPAGKTVYDLISINQKRLTEVLERGVLQLDEWPDDLTLNSRQRWQIEAACTGQERVMHRKLQQFLSSVRRPCYFLDYETVQLPVPRFGGTWPYQQLPFQYSLHVLHADDRLEHHGFLWTERGQCPITPLVESLRRHVGNDGSVLVWWKGFEGKRNEELAAAVPHHADFLLGLNHRMVDLMDTVGKGMWVHPDFGGSASIKKVVPVVAPELAYERLPIGSGAMATLRWKQCVIDDAPPPDVDPATTFAELRDYCRQDTLAMVKIWQHLNHLVHSAAVPVGSSLATGS